MVKKIFNFYNLFLSLGAIYLGSSMILGRGTFDTFPSEWIGVMPFTSWISLGLFGMFVFGVGNAAVAAYGFIKVDKRVFLLTIALGVLLSLCALLPNFLLGESYLPVVYLFIASFFQVFLGIWGLVTKKNKTALN